MDKHSSLFCGSISDEEKQFYNIGRKCQINFFVTEALAKKLECTRFSGKIFQASLIFLMFGSKARNLPT